MCTSAECICVSVSESKIDQFTAIKTRHPIRAPPCLIIVPHIDDRCLWYQAGPACSCHNLQIYHQEAANSPVPGHNFYQFQPPADLNCLPDHNWWYTPTNSMGFIGLDCLGPTWISGNFNFDPWSRLEEIEQYLGSSHNYVGFSVTMIYISHKHQQPAPCTGFELWS